MAKKKSAHRRRKMTLPIAVLGPAVAPAVSQVVAMTKGQTAQATMNNIVWAYSGFNPGTGDFSATKLMDTALPIAAGAIVHWGANKFGVNRILGNAGVPVLRI